LFKIRIKLGTVTSTAPRAFEPHGIKLPSVTLSQAHVYERPAIAAASESVSAFRLVQSGWVSSRKTVLVFDMPHLHPLSCASKVRHIGEVYAHADDAQ
jgi:hypothetical protein